MVQVKEFESGRPLQRIIPSPVTYSGETMELSDCMMPEKITRYISTPLRMAQRKSFPKAPFPLLFSGTPQPPSNTPTTVNPTQVTWAITGLTTPAQTQTATELATFPMTFRIISEPIITL